MNPIKLLIKTTSHNYPIIIGSKLTSNIGKIIKKNSIKFKNCLFIVDSKVPQKLVNEIKKSLKNKNSHTLFIKVNEKNKSQKTINKILKVLLTKNFSRQDCLISIGGGITGDISGFASSLFKRGLQFINIPTTLLSQVDSSIGGKTGINTIYGKNLIGSFYQPKLVISDIAFLKSLPKREIICGYGEVLKHSLISDKSFYKFLDKNVSDILKLNSPYIEKAIFKSCKIKQKVVEKDEKENNYRKVLNFGHTFAHAYEATLGYSKILNHGEAVVLGINSALKFSYKNKLIENNEFSSIINHINRLEHNFNIKNYFSLNHLNKILTFMSKDKKNSSEKINLVLLKKIGHPIINRVYNKKKLRSFLKKELVN